MAVYDPNRKRNARGEQRREELLGAAARVFTRLGYHDATTNAIAADAGVSPATLYQFFPNKEALANTLAARLAGQLADTERALDPDNELPFREAIAALLDGCLLFHRTHPVFHTLLSEAPLTEETWGQKAELAEVFTQFVAGRLRRANATLGEAEAEHHGAVTLAIFRGILTDYAHADAGHREPWAQAMQAAVLRYLEPLVG